MTVPSARRVALYVRRHPHSTCKEIALGLNAPAVLVSALLRALRAAGKLDSDGNTKATRWYPVADE